ncbi:MAG: IclR family transcriptional regulator [Pseudomonadota bacterium]
MNEKIKPEGYQAPAVQKAFQLLALVSKSEQGIGISEIAKTLGISKGTTAGLTQALVKLKVLNQSPQGKKYLLGPTMVELSLSAWNYLKLNKLAQPVLEELRDMTEETVFLGAHSHDRSFIIATAEAAKPIKITSPPGTTIPLLAGATGKVFLALMTDEQCVELIRRHGLFQFTPHAITGEEQYMAELQAVRAQGYALDIEEYMPGVSAIAVSLGNLRGLPLAVWVVGFANTMGTGDLHLMAREVKQLAEKLKLSLDNRL